MEHFKYARTVRIRGRHGKYLWAEDDRTSTTQDRDGACELAIWRVEVVEDNSFEGKPSVIRLKSCFDTYLTASETPFLLGMTGRKVLQSPPTTKNSSVEWEPVSDGSLVKFKTRHGNYLRANGGLPPWRNSVTHDVPIRSATADWILWEVEIVDTIQTDAPAPASPHSQASSFKISSKPDGRLIYYALANDDLEVFQSGDWPNFLYKGTSLEKLKSALKEELGIEEDILICARHPVSSKLSPLRIELPPNHLPLHLVVVKTSSPAAKSFT
ncbi:hypothetical protein O6H91_17G047100 [Diphasiastrum complanatum]|uniref:Uncharacterized protein n=2 Tax=Diphasiastrum complanatum TaxID=34168 RepID=A0ACC2B6F0_DIPCM|nr:hypothetical protein O6H91_17G047100 [Diphasiastrum complanatum]KAJ7525362.1 hypothetical protein O6H91_17G047100 [Diphasiastrum complanatum]